MVRKKDPLVLFLSETKLEDKRLEMLRCKWNFAGKFVVLGRGRSGGLAMFWCQGVVVSISSYSHHHIDAFIEPNTINAWRCTSFYGSPTVEGKMAAWDILRVLKNHNPLPWLCTGDFNELVSRDEKWGRVARPESQMVKFRQVIDDCGFKDLGFSVSPFTWWNKQHGAAKILECLDRSMATMEWLLHFPRYSVHHLQAVFSDHRPLWVELEPLTISRAPRKCFFKFEEMWTLDPGIKETVIWHGKSSKEVL